MKKKTLALLLVLAMIASLIPCTMAATDSEGRYALNANDYIHAYVAQGDSIKPFFRFHSGNRPCGTEARLYRVELTGEETQEELDAMGYELLKSGKKPVDHMGGWLHSVNYDHQGFTVETEYLEAGTYLLVANVWTNKEGLPGASDDEVHCGTACGVGIHVMEEDIPISSVELYLCEEDGTVIRQLQNGEPLELSQAEGSFLYLDVKTYPANATERFMDITSSTIPGNDEWGNSSTVILGSQQESGLYRYFSQHCGTCYLGYTLSGYEEGAETTYVPVDVCVTVPCYPDGDPRVLRWYTCTEPGLWGAPCIGKSHGMCDYIFDEKVLDPPGHILKEVYETITAPTATQRGTGIGLCKNCLSRGIEGHIPAIFTDVKADAFYSEALDHGYANGWVTGLTDTTFGPKKICNRAQVVTFLWRAAGSPEPLSAEHPFVDVAAGSFYEKAVLWAVENGITTGTDATHFSPTQSCNRATVVTFLYRAAQSPAVESTENPFTDVPEGKWYTAPVLWAVENGITNGLGNGIFGVETDCNRAQIVTFLYRAYNK